MPSLISLANQNLYRLPLRDVFDTFARPFSLYIEAKTVNISTDPNWSPFGQHDQMVTNPEVTPQIYTVTGCILYAAKQGYDYSTPYDGSQASQLKLRLSDGSVRIKVESNGYNLLKEAKQVVLDGTTFNVDSAVRPHGIIGAPDRWSFSLTAVD